jgi:hypothetical protein
MFVRAFVGASLLACTPGATTSASRSDASDAIAEDALHPVGHDACTSEIALYPIVWVRSAATGQAICDPTFRLVSPPDDVGGVSIGVSCAYVSGSCPRSIPDGETEACTFGLGDLVATAPFTVEVLAAGYMSRLLPNNTSGYDARGCGGPYKAPSMQTVALTPVPAQGTDAASDAP